MVDTDASDIYLTDGHNPHVPDRGSWCSRTARSPFPAHDTEAIAQADHEREQRKLFAEEHEMNLALHYRRPRPVQGEYLPPAREGGPRAQADQDTDKDDRRAGPPRTLKEIVMSKRGLVLVVGATGSGKSTSLAAMIDHRNDAPAGAHHHHRGPDRVRPSPQKKRRDPAGGGLRHQLLF